MTPHRITPRTKRIALAHDWLVTPRGGESVLEAIASASAQVGECDTLLTMFDSGLSVGPHADRLQRIPSALQYLPFALRARRWLLPAYSLAINDLTSKLAAAHSVRPIDVLVTSSSSAILGLQPPVGVPHLCYIHSPARYLWSLRHEYSKTSSLARCALELLGNKLQEVDRDFARSVTRFIANSHHTARTVKSAYGRDAIVVHPPVRTDFFTPGDGSRDDFWIVAGALEPYKRIDLAIEAARIADRKLVVVGRGSQLHALQSIAHSNVTFITDATDEMLRALFRRARALVHPQVEDFGIIAVEAQSCGLPVVAFAQGGALETVIDGVSGIHVHAQDPFEFARAALQAPKPDAAEIRDSALRFDPLTFRHSFTDALRHIMR